MDAGASLPVSRSDLTTQARDGDVKGITGRLDLSGALRLPMLYQSEAAECGLACLAMMAGYFGHAVDIASLRRRYPLSLRGATLKEVMALAGKLEMTCRPVRLELPEASQLRLPCIVHWDLNHFVVLKKVTRRRTVVHDPAQGARRMPLDEFGRHFTGIALELMPTSSFERKRRPKRLRLADLWTRIEGLKRALVQVFLLSLFIQMFSIAAPFYLQLVVDDVLVSNDRELLVVLAAGFALLACVSAGVWSLRSLLLMYLSAQFSIQVSSNLFHHLVRLPLGWFQSRHIGDVVSRFGSLNAIREFITSSVIESVVDGLMVAGTLAMMSWYSPMLTAVVCLVTGLYLGFRMAVFPAMRRRSEEAIAASARRESNFMETVRSAQTIKVFGKEAQREALWGNAYADALNAGVREGRLTLAYEGINRLLFGGERVLVVYLAALQVMDGGMSVGMLFAFMAYREQFSGKAASLVDRLFQFRLLEMHLGRLADIAHTPVEEEGPSEAPARLRGHIRLENVSFGYAGGETPLLDNLSVEILPGESVAIAGLSGSGKSSLLKLMLGLLQPQAGRVIIDGVGLEALGPRAFRARVGVVLQDDQLLSGTISDNISFFETHPDPMRITEAAGLAAVHEDIVRMPMGYRSLIGDMGHALSGGQRQRILLARALYRRPDILFLDEATAHLDPRTEREVNDNIGAMCLTRVIIAHRQETLRSADRILFLSGGRAREVAADGVSENQAACRP